MQVGPAGDRPGLREDEDPPEVIVYDDIWLTMIR